MPTKTKKSTRIVQEEENEEETTQVEVSRDAEESAALASEEYVVFKRSYFYSIMVVFAFAAGILVGFLAWGRSAPRYAANPSPAGEIQDSAPDAQPEYTRYKIPTDGFPSFGPKNAPITVVEFSDYQCPFCQRFHQDTYKSLLNAYPGQIRFVYRNLPLTSIHPEAMPAAAASLCAQEQSADAYWAYHDKLFSGSLGREAYLQYATELNLDTTAFEACLDSGKQESVVQKDMDFALSLGVRSTPTFFVNGIPIVGAQPLQSFQQLIDKELAGEIP